jgi:hypothetical protein
MSSLWADVHHISRMANCAAYSIFTLAAFMRSPMLLKSSSKCLRKSERFWTAGTGRTRGRLWVTL